MKFELFNDERTLFLTFSECLDAGMSEHAIIKAKARSSNSWVIVEDPYDARKILIGYEKLTDVNKEKVLTRWGNPYDYVVRDPIRRMISQHNEAMQFFLDYRYNGGEKKLPNHRIKQYSRACHILELIKATDENRKLIKELSITVPQFYDHLKAIIQEEQKNGDSETYEGANQLYARFPYHYVSLRDKVKEYAEKGYQCVIDKAYGNDAALKVKDDVAEAQLLTLIENPLQYDDVLIEFMYNEWAKANNYKTIDSSTVGVWRRKKGYLITMGREGNSAYNEKYIRQVKGLGRPQPLQLIEHDDYNFNLLFQDENKKQFRRYISIIVADSHCNLVLGKSYALLGKDMEDTLQQMVRHAHIDAMYYIRSIVNDGRWYAPIEIKADHYAKASLFPYYNKVAKFVPPSVGNKHRGYIEQFFSSPIFKRAEKLISQGNYNGNNMTAKYSGVNPDMLKRSLDDKSRPMIGNDAELSIENFFHLLRHMPDFKRENMNAPSKQEQWLRAFNELPIEKKRPITDEQFLLTYGIEHNPDRPIRITNRGVEPQIKNAKYSYDLPESWMYDKLQGQQVNVISDPFDLSRVLITNHNDIRFIATTAQLQPRSLAQQYTGSRTFLNATLAEKKEQVQRVSDSQAKRRGIANIDYYTAEAMLKGGVMIKEIKNEAEQKMIEQFEQQHEEYLDNNINVNEFL